MQRIKVSELFIIKSKTEYYLSCHWISESRIVYLFSYFLLSFTYLTHYVIQFLGKYELFLTWTGSKKDIKGNLHFFNLFTFSNFISCHHAKRKSFSWATYILKGNFETYFLQWLDLALWCWFKTKPSLIFELFPFSRVFPI